jgi:peptide/nickel transport system substrate-binding protein
MSANLGRRSFLTHTAATLGGVVVAGGIGDGLLADMATAATGVNSGTPRIGGHLKVGVLSDVLSVSNFNGAQASMDASAFSRANAVYDPLFQMSSDGKTVLPMLGLKATPNSNYTVWTVTLRKGVKFTDGTPFNAAAVVANYKATQSPGSPVGPAILPIIKSVVATGPYTVAYNMVIPFSSFDVNLAEQQITFMAAPKTLVSGYKGLPIGTGPFKIVSWTPGNPTVMTANPHYWRKDSHGRKLPYLKSLTFVTIVDDAARNQALQSGSVDMIVTQNNASIGALKSIKNIKYRTDAKDPREPSVNCIILNNSGTLNQFGVWGQLAESYVAAGKPIPKGLQQAVLSAQSGSVNPSTLQWEPGRSGVLSDETIRQACAFAINRTQFLKTTGAGVGTVADGIYRTNSPYYKNPNYPNYNPNQAKSLVNAYKSKNNVTSVAFVMDIVAGSNAATQAFGFIQQQLAAVGITVTPRPVQQGTLIANVIQGSYDSAQWNQFGGVDQGLNYVWWDSVSATDPFPVGLSLTSLPAGPIIPGEVNFAHQADRTIEQSMAAALSLPRGSASSIANWQTVNSQFAKNVNYLFLTHLLTAFAARNNVQNWLYATAGDGVTRTLNPDGGSARWDQIWTV